MVWASVEPSSPSNHVFRISEMKNFNKIVDAILLLPAVVWSFIGIIDILKNGLYSYTFLLPFPFKIHTFTLLPITTFYLTTFLTIKPHKPVRNFLAAFLFIFISMATYELVYGIFMINTHMFVPHFEGAPPMRLHHRMLPFGPFEGSIWALLGGIPLLFFLNRRFHFLTSDKRKIFLFLTCFSSFIAVMLTLNHLGFFAQMHLYLSGQTTNDPHNPLWILSKILCVWMFFLLLDFRSNSLISQVLDNPEPETSKDIYRTATLSFDSDRVNDMHAKKVFIISAIPS